MSGLAVLEERLDLVLRSAKMQRATIAIRLNRIEARPGMTLFQSALHLLNKTWGRRAAIIALGIVLRATARRRSVSRPRHRSSTTAAPRGDS